MAIDAKSSAVEAIAAYLETALGANASKVIRGWPEDAEEMDLSGAPVISITPPSRMTRVPCAPKSIDSATVGDVTTHSYRVAWLSMTVQIDAWAGYRAQLDDLVPLVEAACIAAPPANPELQLTSTDYYSRPLTCVLGDLADDLDGDTAKKGEWRLSWDMRVETDAIRQTPHVPLVQVDLAVTVDGNDETTTAFE